MSNQQQSIKAFFVSAGHLKHQFASSHCVLPISVGHAYHEGERLKAIIKLINEHFDRCTIIVCDTLQRHSLDLYHSDVQADEAFTVAQRLGKEWVARNQTHMNDLSIDYSVAHWNDWLLTDDFKIQKEKTEYAHKHQASIKDALENTINFFVDRYFKRMPESTSARRNVLSKARDYVVEECSVMPLWRAITPAFEIYPGKRSAAMTAVHQHFLCPDHADLLQRLHLNFRKVTRYFNNASVPGDQSVSV